MTSEERDREQLIGTVLLLNLIGVGDVKVTLVREGQPASMTHQSTCGMALAAEAMMIVYGITEDEVHAYTERNELKAKETH